jgi:CRISPR-associated protein Cas2
MRRCYLVTYDIRNPKRLRTVCRIVKAYGQRWQYSVFFCVLKDIDFVRLQGQLREAVNRTLDQVLIFDLGSEDGNPRDKTIRIGAAVPESLGRIEIF